MAGFNKMFVMVPVMLAARKLDGEDPNVVYWLRVAYFSVQALIILLVAYTYIQATTIAAKAGNDRVVYIPPAASVCLFVLTTLLLIWRRATPTTHSYRTFSYIIAIC